MSLRFEELDLPRRRRFCEEAATRLGLPAPSIEKDYWVCWTLKALFGLPEAGETLTFKGGTSLAKAWQIIDRFSEDVDVVIDRAALGCDGASDPAADSISNKERDRRLDRLQAAAAEFAATVILPGLRRAVSDDIAEHGRWRVVLDPHTKDGQTILLEYPSEFAHGYVSNVVKVELGARSDTDPKECIEVRSHLGAALESKVLALPTWVRAVRPERTLLEKVMLLHEEGFRNESSDLKGECRGTSTTSYALRSVGSSTLPCRTAASSIGLQRIVACSSHATVRPTEPCVAENCGWFHKERAFARGKTTTERCRSRCSGPHRRRSNS